MKESKQGNWFSRHKILSALLILVVIGIVVGASGGDSNTTNSNDTKQAEQQETTKETTAKIGEAARDGKFEFTVHGVNCEKTELGNDFLNKEAQGKFCIVDITVKNIGDKAQGLSDSNQYAYNAEGHKYSADSEAALYLDDSAAKIYEEINPGNTIKGKIIFDIPKDVTLTSLELHDSAFSGGVKVNL